MSLSRARRCATCRKSEDQVKIKTCSFCEVMSYCSHICAAANQPFHRAQCRDIQQIKDLKSDHLKIDVMLEIAMAHDHHRALEIAVEIMKKSTDRVFTNSFQSYVNEAPFMICFQIELGKIKTYIL